jgi:ABC-2 type transport system ATP-binding protein
MADAISVRGLRKVYGALSAVDGIDFRVGKGEIFSFLGPNGAGKTTTVEILEGLRSRSGGEVEVLGLDPWRDSATLHRQIGVIPQGFRFFDKVTPREGIDYYAALFGKKVDADRLLKRVILHDKADDIFEKLSGGQKQKLGLALALVNEPDLLFLDEPTTGLDPQARRAVWDVLRDLKREGHTVFLTTHYLDEAQELADRVAIIHHGKILTEGTPQDLIQRHGRPSRLVLKVTPELKAVLQRQVGLHLTWEEGQVHLPLSEKAALLKTLETVNGSGLPWPEISTRRDTLEDVFIQLVGKMADEGELAA